MNYQKIVVLCSICNCTLVTVTAAGNPLTDADVSNYQQNTSCNTDGNSNIQVVPS